MNHAVYYLFACVSVFLSSLGYSDEVKLSRQEMNLIESMRQEIPVVSHSGPISLANLNLNRLGSVTIARPGEKIFCTLNFSCDPNLMDPDALNQIVIGFSEVGSQKCIFNELGYRCGEGILSFFLEAPKKPGIYEIQCRLDQAFSPNEAMARWWDEGDNPTWTKMTIGKVVVR